MARDGSKTPTRLVEAVLAGSPSALSCDEIAARLPFPVDVAEALAELSLDYEGRSLEVVEAIAGKFAIRTKPEFSDLCRRFFPRPWRVSRAAYETLAVVAAFQPVTRSEIERVRGVALAKGTLDALVFAGWVAPGPRRETAGNPMTFRTTDAFLQHFGVRSADDLPGVAALKADGLADASAGVSFERTDGAEDLS